MYVDQHPCVLLVTSHSDRVVSMLLLVQFVGKTNIHFRRGKHHVFSWRRAQRWSCRGRWWWSCDCLCNSGLVGEKCSDSAHGGEDDGPLITIRKDQARPGTGSLTAHGEWIHATFVTQQLSRFCLVIFLRAALRICLFEGAKLELCVWWGWGRGMTYHAPLMSPCE